MTTYRVWHTAIDPPQIGLAGAARLLRIHTRSEHLRQGHVWKTTEDTSFALSSPWESQASVLEAFEAIRGHWSIENRQHYRRDRTQDEDRCGMRHNQSAQNLFLFPSLAIFLFEQQRGCAGRPVPCRSMRSASCAGRAS